MNMKDWVIVVLTAVFVALYVLALAGVLQPPGNDKLVVQISPIISVIIGYYFGRIPGEKNEQTLRQQVNDTRNERQQAVDQMNQAQNARNDAVQQRERLATKIADAKAALSAAAPAAPPEQLAATLSGGGAAAPDPEAVQKAATAALKVLETP
ncbi:putative Co/Zn/Cd cation transporter (cation efflux family) [Bradyrhizobium sp. USDA 4501]